MTRNHGCSGRPQPAAAECPVRPLCVFERIISDLYGVRFMTDLLEKSLSQVSKLPPAEQDAVAAILIEELASEEQMESGS
jgi:hypothetical protein